VKELGMLFRKRKLFGQFAVSLHLAGIIVCSAAAQSKARIKIK
jgi:hypothetical protein